MKHKSKFDLKLLLGQPTSISEQFHEHTKITKLSRKPDDPSKWPQAWKTIFLKEYLRLDKIVLPEPDLDDTSLKEALVKRSSQRQYSQKPLSLEDLSTLLYFSAGSKDPTGLSGRFYPSAGGRYPLEVYLISQNSELPRGVYHYNIRYHSLETLLILDKFNADDYFNQDFIKKASIIILLTAHFKRNTIKYGQRGYRHVISEAGHIGQNFWLISTALDLAICGVGGYLDDKLNELLDIDGLKETVIYVLIVGKKAKK